MSNLLYNGMLVLVIIVAALQLCSSVSLREIYKNRMRHGEYDYIVVGSGASGAVVASRLSEDESVSVLLLEAGGLPTGLTEVPLLGLYLIGSDLDWAYYSEPQKDACFGAEDKKAFIPRGKALGGSTAVNSMMYLRGDRKDYDNWAKNGATGWDWENVLYYYKKLEDNTDPSLAIEDIHGTGGPQTVSISHHMSELGEAIMEAGDYLGYSRVDLNAESPYGFSKNQGTVRDGLRCSTEKGYLRPAASRPNLDILYKAHVTKILVDENKRAHSVRFEQNSASHVVRAKKEIVLSAGAIGTPQILMLSGIGPRQHLEDMGIPVLADLPVGQNLQDHVMVGGQAYTVNAPVGLRHNRVVNYQSIGQMMEGEGPLTVPLGVEVVAAINTKYENADHNYPDIRLHFLTFLLAPPEVDQVTGKVKIDASPLEGMSVNPSVCRTKSRGFVKLRSTDPYDPPVIDPRYLSHQDDLNILSDSIRLTEEIMKTPSLAKFNPIRTPSVVAGCETMDIASEAYRTCVAKTLTVNGYHQCCTAKMGNLEDPTAVVDLELRVKGVSGLRVADASVMPTVPSANTVAPCIMIGEKAADLIKGRYYDPVQKKIVTRL